MMRLWGSSPTMLWLPLVFLFSVWCAHAKKDGPRIHTKSFDTPPIGLQYFKGSNTVLVFEAQLGILWRSSNAGKDWDKAKENIKGFYLHPHDDKKAYALGGKNEHWTTDDRGKSWDKFEIDDGLRPAMERIPLAFHAEDSKKVIFNVEKCHGFRCEEEALYTTDNFEKKVKSLKKDTSGCIFAHATSEFTPSADDKDDSRVFCIVRSRSSSRIERNRLLMSDKYFDDDGIEPLLHDGRTVQGIINIAVEKKFVITAAKGEGSFELALYVSTDAKSWHRAEFPNNPKLEQDAYTILESSNHSIQVDVMTTRPLSPMGILFSSDSTGKYFTENIKHTNRNIMGYVDYERVSGIDGIVLVNVVDNWQEVERSPFEKKKVKSKISFDDGRTFKKLRARKNKDSKGDGEELHLHSVTDISNSGRVFSSPAPGIVMGIGNTGDFLKAYDEGDLYVSDDAGLTWWKGLSEAHKYEIGGQGSVLLAVYDEGQTKKVSYSIDHGASWEEKDLDDEVTAKVLTQTPDSTSLKFILEAIKRKGSKTEYQIITIDFEGLHERDCKKDDFEDWYARLDDDGKPDCIMGHKQKYRRRKWDADCFVNDEFKEPKLEEESCSCTDEDFECDFEFERDGKDCKPVKGVTPPKGACASDDKTFKGPSGWRLIPGDTCDRDGKNSVEKDKDVERDCEDAKKPAPPKSGKLGFEQTPFKGAESFGQKVYLERGTESNDKDETVIMRTVSSSGSKIYISRDHGKTWVQKFKDVKDDIVGILPHAYTNDMVFFLTLTDKIYYSINRGETIEEFKVPKPMNRDGIIPLSFHPDKKDWFIWIGSDECDHNSANCHSVAYYSQDRGDDWKTLARYCKKCEFVKTKEGKDRDDKLVYCEQFKDEKLGNPLQLRSSTEWFADEPKPHFDDILSFATMSEFIIVAKKDPKSNLQVEASVDGSTFAQAKFPSDFNVPVQTAYTVLDSSTNSVFLHVTVGSREGFEYGRVMKSNSNGTNYVLSIGAVNRNTEGYVDFEKMQGLEGVAMVNIVDNLDDERGGNKKLRSMITHNDGAEWTPINAPQKDDHGKAFGCDVGNPSECSLHLHSYTEREDPSDTFSSASAVGLMMGVGNVGKYMGSKGDDDVYTFITRDGGISWSAAKKGNFMWEYGDQGSIIIIVEEGVDTNLAYYTLDEGRTWKEFEFHDEKLRVMDLTTVPSDTSVNFLFWGKKPGRNEAWTINVDFAGIRSRQCKLNEDHGSNLSDGADEGDYKLWLAKHPLQPNGCLFGHKAFYHRKKIDADCFNGRRIDRGHNEVDAECPCTRQDFECDYNYETASDNTCKLVTGLDPKDHSKACDEDPELETYFLPQGYRKIPLSTCSGGDKKYLGEELPCPNFKKKFEEGHRGMGGFWIFILAVVLPFCLAGGIGYWVYNNHGGAFGRIRLGDTGSAFDADQPWIHYPVAALSAVVAVLAAVPFILGAGWRAISGMFGGGRRYTTRQSFQRGRGDYAVVDPDEDELLGEDDDEEV